MTLPVDEVEREGRASFPAIALERDALAAYLAERAEADAAHAADLFLACACLRGNPAALAEFHARFLDDLGFLRTIADRSTLTLDEIRQELAIRLLVPGPDGAVRLAGYTGKGPLAGWVRVAATRLAIDLQRSGRREQPGSDPDAIDRLVEAASVELDGELVLLRERYTAAFRAALHDALAALDASYRAMLRLHYLEGMTTAALAAVYKVSRNTVVRRIAEARTALFEATLELLTSRVGLPPDEYSSLLRLVRSQLDVSIARLLASPD